ncbi:MAG: hypothetical protein R6X02_29835 [Enhygromyxa sp.]
MDPASDTVVIDDELAEGFARLERAVADKPRVTPAPSSTTGDADPATQGSSAFAFRGGPRYTPILLAVVLPFAWLAVLYFALANLLAETARDRGANEANEARIEQLERELQGLRSELAGAPRTAKTKPKREKPKPKPKPKPKAEAEAEAEAEAQPKD